MHCVARVRLVVRPLALLLVVAISGCATGIAPSPTPPDASASAPPTQTPEPTPTPPVYWPLRGTLAPSADAIHKRPVLVRIPNDTAARPQSGLSKADMVWELLAEGGITRYMAVFQSEEVDQIGPIRSARLSDLHYAPMLRGILAHVGASTVVLSRVRAAAAKGEFIDADQFLYGDYYTRVTFRAAPQNVYTSTQRIRQAAKAAGDLGNVDVPALPIARNVEPVTERTGTSFSIPYLGAMAVRYSYDARADGYTRVQAGVTTTDATTGKAVVAANVVVIFTDITPQPGIIEDSNGSLSLEIRSTGTGKVVIFRNGARLEGTWSRSGNDGYTFADLAGLPLSLVPGQTWVHVIPNDWTVTSAP